MRRSICQDVLRLLKELLPRPRVNKYHIKISMKLLDITYLQF